jgi:8-amino-7-oxononanoate synthase
MKPFREELEERLAALRGQNLFRELRHLDSPQSPYVRMGNRAYLNCSSNDYLGFASHPALRVAATRALEHYGAGSGASRLVCGTLTPHQELEETIARFKGTESALSFASGYDAAVGAIPALVGRDDVIILDKLVHASIVDGARLSGAKLRIFDHNDTGDLEKILQWAADRRSSPAADAGPSQILVVTESVFSMDGDLAPLAEIIRLKEKYGAWLMLDEAHATGLYGPTGAGLAQAGGFGSQVEIQMGTLSKAVGASGGYICGVKPLIDLLINRARSFIFSTAPMPAAAATAKAGLDLIRGQQGETRRTTLWHRVESFCAELGLKNTESAIIPFIIGDEAKAMAKAAALREQGVLIPAVRYPTVARGQARLRITISASHSASDLSRVAQLLRE